MKKIRFIIVLLLASTLFISCSKEKKLDLVFDAEAKIDYELIKVEENLYEKLDSYEENMLRMRISLLDIEEDLMYFQIYEDYMLAANNKIIEREIISYNIESEEIQVVYKNQGEKIMEFVSTGGRNFILDYKTNIASNKIDYKILEIISGKTSLIDDFSVRMDTELIKVGGNIYYSIVDIDKDTYKYQVKMFDLGKNEVASVHEGEIQAGEDMFFTYINLDNIGDKYMAINFYGEYYIIEKIRLYDGSKFVKEIDTEKYANVFTYDGGEDFLILESGNENDITKEGENYVSHVKKDNMRKLIYLDIKSGSTYEMDYLDERKPIILARKGNIFNNKYYLDMMNKGQVRLLEIDGNEVKMESVDILTDDTYNDFYFTANKIYKNQEDINIFYEDTGELFRLKFNK